MSVVACAPPDNASLLRFHMHDTPARPHFPACALSGAAPPIVANASALDLHAWNVVLMRMLLSRRRMTAQERTSVRRALGHLWFGKGRTYVVLQHTLHEAVHNEAFQKLVVEKRALWLEFGVLTGLSTNLTSLYLQMVPNVPVDARVDGFDTFTGLPEAWPNGKGVRPRGTRTTRTSMRASEPPRATQAVR